mgnify:CR=1 FL=1
MERQRFTYDLSHYSFQTGRIGSLMTLSHIPIIAGDSIEVNLQGVFRLSPLRRNLTVDCRVDLFAFYVPYRHIYGQNWIDFLKQGLDESITFSTVNSGTAVQAYLGASHFGVLPLWLVAGYNRIWNRYFRHPTDDAGEVADTAFPTAGNGQRYGRECAHLPAIWNTPIDAEVDSSDLQVATTGDILDLTELAQQKARLVTERRREFFSQRYKDVLGRTWGSSVNIDADERPELCMRQSAWMSGYDVDGTADATLGTYSGKAATVAGLRMPRKKFPEHGTLWIMGLLRFPPIHELEKHFLASQSNPTYKQIAGDPDVIANEPPETISLVPYFNNVFAVGFATDVGIAPYAQWYRMHPNHVHFDYDAVNGFTFLSGGLGSKALARYVSATGYDEVFQTTQLGHWQCQTRLDVLADRVVPPVDASIFAGSR